MNSLRDYRHEDDSQQAYYVAYIRTFRGTGRPETACVAEIPRGVDLVSEQDVMRAVDPMAHHHHDYAYIGVFDSFESACDAADAVWSADTTIDDRGYTQWA
jgi:hypothetical protein